MLITEQEHLAHGFGLGPVLPSFRVFFGCFAYLRSATHPAYCDRLHGRERLGALEYPFPPYWIRPPGRSGVALAGLV